MTSIQTRISSLRNLLGAIDSVVRSCWATTVLVLLPMLLPSSHCLAEERTTKQLVNQIFHLPSWCELKQLPMPPDQWNQYLRAGREFQKLTDPAQEEVMRQLYIRMIETRETIQHEDRIYVFLRVVFHVSDNVRRYPIVNWLGKNSKGIAYPVEVDLNGLPRIAYLHEGRSGAVYQVMTDFEILKETFKFRDLTASKK